MSLSLLEQITAAVDDEYDVVGELGASTRGSAFLARERAGGHLVVLAVPPAADELTVLGALSDQVPANAGTCTICGHAPPAFTAHCQQCGRAFVLGAADVHRFTAAEVTEAAGHAYELLGEVAHQSGGSLFFVRDRADGRLVALAAQRHPSGGASLEAVWDAIRGSRGASLGGGAAAAFDAPAPEVAAGYAPGVAFDPGPTVELSPHAFPDAPAYGAATGAELDAAPGYPPDYRPPAPDADEPARPRRRWVPFAVAGAVLVAAGGAWAAMRGEHPESANLAPRDSAAVVQATPTPPAESAGRGSVAAEQTPVPPPPPPPADTPRVSSAADSVRDARRAAADSARRAQSAPAYVQLDGANLPGDWTWTINGRRGPRALTAPLRPNRPVSLIIEAPGYCPEVLNLPALAPGSVQRWAPRLRGKPMVGECVAPPASPSPAS